MKTNSVGGLVWEKSYGGSGLDFAYDLIENEDGSVMVVGETASTDFNTLTSKGNTDLVLLKIK